MKQAVRLRLGLTLSAREEVHMNAAGFRSLLLALLKRVMETARPWPPGHRMTTTRPGQTDSSGQGT
jgi:hypothetical protein